MLTATKKIQDEPLNTAQVVGLSKGLILGSQKLLADAKATAEKKPKRERDTQLAKLAGRYAVFFSENQFFFGANLRLA
jgi:hypothetical protein